MFSYFIEKLFKDVKNNIEKELIEKGYIDISQMTGFLYIYKGKVYADLSCIDNNCLATFTTDELLNEIKRRTLKNE